jgi:hypothetical protein
MTFLPRLMVSFILALPFAQAVEPGFEVIFDGKTLDGWKHGGHWAVMEGEIACVKKGGSLVYEKAKVPDDFELRFDWKVAKGCNSGVYYRPGQYEYQLLDNANSPYGENPRQAAALLHRPEDARFDCLARHRLLMVPFQSDFSEAISMEKRYFTSDLSMRS